MRKKAFVSALLLACVFFLPACAGVNGDRFEPESLLGLRGKPREEVIEALGLKKGEYIDEGEWSIAIEGQMVMGTIHKINLRFGPMDAKEERVRGLYYIGYGTEAMTHEEAFQYAKGLSERFDREYGVPTDFSYGCDPDRQPRLSSFSSYEDYRASEERPLTELWEPCEGWRIASTLSTPAQFPVDGVVTIISVYDSSKTPI